MSPGWRGSQWEKGGLCGPIQRFPRSSLSHWNKRLLHHQNLSAFNLRVDQTLHSESQQTCQIFLIPVLHENVQKGLSQINPLRRSWIHTKNKPLAPQLADSLNSANTFWKPPAHELTVLTGNTASLIKQNNERKNTTTKHSVSKMQPEETSTRLTQTKHSHILRRIDQKRGDTRSLWGQHGWLLTNLPGEVC